MNELTSDNELNLDFRELKQFLMSLLNLDLWNMDGHTIAQLGEDDFKWRLPQGGDNMYSQFDIWRSSSGYDGPMMLPSSCGQSIQKISNHAPPCYQEPAHDSQEQVHAMTGQDNANSSTDNYMDIAFMLQMLDSHHNPAKVPTTQYITPKMLESHHNSVGLPTTQYITPKMLESHHNPAAVPTTQYITPKMLESYHNPVGLPETHFITHKIMDNHHNPIGVSETHYITPKTEPEDIPHTLPCHSMSPPSYTGSDYSMSPPPYPGSDHPLSPPSYMGSDHHPMSPPAYMGSDFISELGTVDFGIDFMDDEEGLSISTGSPSCAGSSLGSPSCAGSSFADEEDETRSATASPPSRPRTNIHLWQFIKELLLQPHLYGNFIHWIDRQKGIYKIVDSVKVATLWGKRKNRPAMNYDKLSRSLRQYYKKGIMKKTEQSQRLVYQFCHPYHL